MNNIFGTNFQGSTTFTGNIDLGGNKITNSASPTNPLDVPNKLYVDTLINDIETGSIALNFNQPNFLIYGSNNPDPEHPSQYTGTQGLLQTDSISNGAVTGDKIANLSITNAKIANGTIETNKISSIDGSKIVVGSINNNQINNNANIDGTKLADNTVTNAKILSIDGSKVIDGTITSAKIANGTISNIDIAGNADIEQAKILGLPGINTDVNTLKNYFLDSRLKLSNLAKSLNNYQVLSQDGSANDPAYRQIDSNYISSLNLNKINMNTNNQNILYCDSLSFNNLTTFINSLPTSGNAVIYPFSLNTANGYTITNNDTWLAINCSVNGHYKGTIASNVIVGNSSIATLNIGNTTSIYGQYYTNLVFNNVTTNINIFLNGYFENINFKAVNLNITANSFVMFYNCTFNNTFTVTNVGTSSSVFMFNCNFTNKSILLSGSNSGNVIFSNCSNLPTNFLITRPTNFILIGINSEYVSPTQSISDLRVNQMTVPTLLSNLAIGNNKITTTATTFNNNELVTKSYVDSIGTNILPLDNNWTGINTFNLASLFNSAVTLQNITNSSRYIYNPTSTTTHRMLDQSGSGFWLISPADLLDPTSTARFYYESSKFSTRLFEILNNDSLVNSRVHLRGRVEINSASDGIILIGTGSSRVTDTDGSYVQIGNNTSAQIVAVGRDAFTDNGTTELIDSYCYFGSQRTDHTWISNFTSIGFRNPSGECILRANTGVISVISTLESKMNIINKTYQFITSQQTPVKNYWNNLLSLNGYTYVYRKKDENGNYLNEPSIHKEIVQGFLFDEIYEKFPHATGYPRTLDDDPNINNGFPSIEVMNASKEGRSISMQKLIPYIVMSLQEFDKFHFKPLQQKYNELETKYNNLVNYLKQQQILPSDF